MSSDIRIFTAESMDAALELVRRDLGSDAIILHTRQIEKRRLLPWPRVIQEVEITAGVGVKLKSSSARPMPEPEPVAAEPVRSSEPIAPPSRPHEDLAPPPVLLPGRTTIAARSRRHAEPIATPELPVSEPVAKKAEVLPAVAPIIAPLPTVAAPINRRVPSTVIATRLATAGDPTADIQQRLDLLQKMIADLGRKPRNEILGDVPPELFHVYTQLLDSEVDEESARELVAALKRTATAEQLADSRAMMSVLTALIEKKMPTTGPLRPERGLRSVVAFVGPTGVGKTTTLAKMAANYRLREGLRVGLVTVDTYRIAAVEQLRTYADIIDLPMKVVTSPKEMRRALDELAGLDLVFIDTAGRSPRDDLKLQELKSLLDEARADQVYLVLSLSAGSRAIEAAAEQFRCVSPTAAILTKLDEALGCGSLVSLPERIGLPVSYLTMGQDVPDDIEPAQSSRMAQLALGLDSVRSLPMSDDSVASIARHPTMRS